MPVACIAIPHFALHVAILHRPELDGAPLVLGPPEGERPVVIDATPEAAARGIRPGLGLRDVIALCPKAIILTPHPMREAAAFEQIMAGLESLSPAVEPDTSNPGSFYVDLHGLERRLGPPLTAAELLISTMPAALRPRVGIAPGKFAARIAAGCAKPGSAYLVDTAAVTTFLARASVRWLPISPEMGRRFERLGIRTLGNLAALPLSAVQARFGPSGRVAWNLASGRDNALIRPRPAPDTVIEQIELPAPATSLETLLVALTRLALRAFDRPILQNRHARQAQLRGALEGGGSWEHVALLKEPGSRGQVIKVLSYRLQAALLPGPIETLTLELSGLTNVVGRQDRLPGIASRRPWQLAEASRQLKQRYGTSGLYRVVEVEPWSRIPERRQALIPYDPLITPDR